MAQVILPPVQNVARFAVSGTWETRPWTNIFHGQYSQQPGDSVTMGLVANAVLAAYDNAFGALMHNSVQITQCVGQDLASRQGAVGVGTTGFVGGGSTAAVSSVQIAVCASWVITDRYRGGHPRTYLPGMLAVNTTNGFQLTPGAVTAYKNAAAAFLTNFNAMTAGGGTWKLCCVRYFSEHQLLPNPYVRLIGGSTIHPRLDSMRRRLGKETP